MAQVTITINSREYAVSCEDGQEVRILQLARILDEKAKMLTQGSGQINECMMLAMVGLLVADELSEIKKSGGATSNDVETVDKSRLLKIDTSLAERIKSLSEQINLVAKNIELL